MQICVRHCSIAAKRRSGQSIPFCNMSRHYRRTARVRSLEE
jgi:hypothetical protein